MRNNYLLDKDDEHDLAIEIACKKFEKLYPLATQPAWLKYCMSMNVTKNDAQNWVAKMKLRPKYTLQPDEYWTWDDDGEPILVRADPVTGKK